MYDFIIQEASRIVKTIFNPSDHVFRLTSYLAKGWWVPWTTDRTPVPWRVVTVDSSTETTSTGTGSKNILSKSFSRPDFLFRSPAEFILVSNSLDLLNYSFVFFCSKQFRTIIVFCYFIFYIIFLGPRPAACRFVFRLPLSCGRVTSWPATKFPSGLVSLPAALQSINS